jgi:hypothetical protein
MSASVTIPVATYFARSCSADNFINCGIIPPPRGQMPLVLHGHLIQVMALEQHGQLRAEGIVHTARRKHPFDRIRYSPECRPGRFRSGYGASRLKIRLFDHDPAARFDAPQHPLKRRLIARDMNHHIPRMHQIEGGRRKLHVADIALQDFDGRAPASPQETRVRVDGHDLARWPDPLF